MNGWLACLVVDSVCVPQGRTIIVFRPPTMTFGAIAPMPYEPAEVLLTMYFDELEDAEKFALKPIITAGTHGLLAWKCPAPSGIECCQYNVLDDPAMDRCIHCGEPYERK